MSLNHVYDAPPIVCHHDFRQCQVDESRFPENVHFCHPHISTHWGHITLPLAALQAFSILRDRYQPKWYFLLSGSDYPVCGKSDVIDELSACSFDAYLDNRRIPFDLAMLPKVGRFDDKVEVSWIALVHARYVSRELAPEFDMRKEELDSLIACIPNATEPGSSEMSRADLLQDAEISRQVYAGDFWFHANDKAISYLLESPIILRLARYYREVSIPEESFLHTALCNNSELSISPKHRRYEDWSGGGSHPKWLEKSDVEKCVSSRAYFARKFRPDGAVQRWMDEAILHIMRA